MSLVDNFDVKEVETDDIASRFYKGNSWAYSSMSDTKKERFISLSTRRYRKLSEFVTPEFTIFHEIGHYQIADRLKIAMFTSNMNQIEMKCDRYGLYALIRMLYFNKHYKTISVNETQITFEQSLRNLLSKKFKKKKVTTQELRVGFAEIVNDVVKLMSWENIYE
jgi:hypothetical protein